MPRNIYCWHEPEHEAIKVGVGENGNGRMLDYAKEYGLAPDPETLRTFDVPVGFDVLLIEKHCHALLIEEGMKRFPVVTELFRLNTSYDEAADMVERMVEHCIDCFKSGSEIDYNDVRTTGYRPSTKTYPPTPLMPGGVLPPDHKPFMSDWVGWRTK